MCRERVWERLKWKRESVGEIESSGRESESVGESGRETVLERESVGERVWGERERECGGERVGERERESVRERVWERVSV